MFDSPVNLNKIQQVIKESFANEYNKCDVGLPTVNKLISSNILCSWEIYVIEEISNVDKGFGDVVIESTFSLLRNLANLGVAAELEQIEFDEIVPNDSLGTDKDRLKMLATIQLVTKWCL